MSVVALTRLSELHVNIESGLSISVVRIERSKIGRKLNQNKSISAIVNVTLVSPCSN